jgi:dienelactone hydrolase
MKLLTLLAFFFAASIASADLVQKTIPYELDGVQFEGTLIYDADEADDPLPGIVMIPNWMGPTENAFKKARMIADDEYVVFVADMYGVEVRPANSAESSEAAGFVRGDRKKPSAFQATRPVTNHRRLPRLTVSRRRTYAFQLCLFLRVRLLFSAYACG